MPLLALVMFLFPGGPRQLRLQKGEHTVRLARCQHFCQHACITHTPPARLCSWRQTPVHVGRGLLGLAAASRRHVAGNHTWYTYVQPPVSAAIVLSAGRPGQVRLRQGERAAPLAQRQHGGGQACDICAPAGAVWALVAPHACRKELEALTAADVEVRTHSTHGMRVLCGGWWHHTLVVKELRLLLRGCVTSTRIVHSMHCTPASAACGGTIR
jgi:hypothetical protein